MTTSEPLVTGVGSEHRRVSGLVLALPAHRERGQVHSERRLQERTLDWLSSEPRAPPCLWVVTHVVSSPGVWVTADRSSRCLSEEPRPPHRRSGPRGCGRHAVCPGVGNWGLGRSEARRGGAELWGGRADHPCKQREHARISLGPGNCLRRHTRNPCLLKLFKKCF